MVIMVATEGFFRNVGRSLSAAQRAADESSDEATLRREHFVDGVQLYFRFLDDSSFETAGISVDEVSALHV